MTWGRILASPYELVPAHIPSHAPTPNLMEPEPLPRTLVHSGLIPSSVNSVSPTVCVCACVYTTNVIPENHGSVSFSSPNNQFAYKS